jgi:penicillin-binding protein 1A
LRGRPRRRPSGLLAYQPPLPTNVRGYDGTPVQTFARERRVELSYDEYPPLVVHAFISAEDKTFFSHMAASTIPAWSARWRLYRKSGQRRRAPRADRPSPSRSPNICCRTSYNIGRKIREAILAFRLESTLSKQQILELYLNSIFLGRNAYGVQAAARAYFDKDVGELTLPEGGLSRGPAQGAEPITTRSARPRRRSTGATMCSRDGANGYITEDQRAAAAAEPLGTIRYGSNEKFRQQGGYFMEEVRRELIKKFGEKPRRAEQRLCRRPVGAHLDGSRRCRTRGREALRDGLAASTAAAAGATPASASTSKATGAGQLDRAPVGTGFPTGARRWCCRRRRRRRRSASPTARPGRCRPRRGDAGARRRRRGVRFLTAGHDHHRQAGRGRAAMRCARSRGRGGWSPRKSHRPGAGDAGRLRRRSARATTARPRRCASPARRSSRSSMSTALENGMTPASIIVDAPFCVWQGAGSATNASSISTAAMPGRKTMRWGVEQSRNLMTVRAASQTGMPKVIATPPSSASATIPIICRSRSAPATPRCSS